MSDTDAELSTTAVGRRLRRTGRSTRWSTRVTAQAADCRVLPCTWQVGPEIEQSLPPLARHLRHPLRVDPLEFCFMLCDNGQPLVPSPLELAANKSVPGIDCVELPLCSGRFEARLLQ